MVLIKLQLILFPNELASYTGIGEYHPLTERVKNLPYRKDAKIDIHTLKLPL
jgi:hypothetical protein